MKNILIVTGGSGGHVTPSTTIFDHLKDDFDVKIVTDRRGSKFIDVEKYNYEIIDVPKLFSKLFLLPINIIRYLNNFLKSASFIKSQNINILISTGGYTTFPFCVAAFFLKKKIILLEPNSVIGRSNKIALKFSDKIICYDNNLKKFPNKYKNKKVIMRPILKKEIYSIKKNHINKKEIKKILIIGGSQGASFFDNKITELILNISKKKNLEIIQQISNDDSFSDLKKKYYEANIRFNFFRFSKIAKHIFNGVDLAITRGGANTLSELAFLNIPFISIPLPTAKDNHQFYNSHYYYEKDCCWIIDQKKFDINNATNLVLEILNNKNNYDKIVSNLKKNNEKNSWNNIKQNIIEIINAN